MRAHTPKKALTLLATLGALGPIAMLVTSPPAYAGEYALHATCGSAGKGTGQFEGESPNSVAVDGASGDVYGQDSGENRRIEKFDSECHPLPAFNGSETPAKEFAGEAHGIAVDQSASVSKGDVYVADSENAVVDKFNSKGEYVCQLTGVEGGCVKEGGKPKEAFSTVEGVAVDGQGDVYVGTLFGASAVDEFGPAGEDVAQITAPLLGKVTFGVAVDSEGNLYAVEGFSFESTAKVIKLTLNSGHHVVSESVVDSHKPGAVAVDPSTNDVFVLATEGGDHVVQYDKEGHLLGEFGAGHIAASIGLAFSTFNNDVYVADNGADRIDVFSNEILPEATTGACEPLGTSAVLHGEVNPKGEPAGYYFEYGEGESLTTRTPEASAGSGSVAVPVEAHLSALEPNTKYSYRLFATNSHGALVEGAKRTCTTHSVAPSASTLAASSVGPRSATLNATIDPRNTQTRYVFEYVSDQSYDPSAADPYHAGAIVPLTQAEAGSGSTSQPVQQRLEELSPSTGYHYRVIATNELGEATDGADQTFTTAASVLPTVGVGEAFNVTQIGATVTATIDTHGLATSYQLELGAGAGFEGETKIFGSLLPEEGATEVVFQLSGLASGTNYSYRVTATNTYGTALSEVRSFMTGSFTPTIFQPVALALIPVPVIPLEKQETPKKHGKAPKHKTTKHKKKHSSKRPKGKTKAKTRGGRVR